MKAIKYIGLIIFLIGITVFTVSSFIGDFKLSKESLNTEIESLVSGGAIKSEIAKVNKIGIT